MPFDPTKPANNSPNSSAEMRSQLVGLKALIDAMASVNVAVVDAVDTLPPGNAATVGLSVVGTELHFTFAIPQGLEGAQGQQGNDGAQGPPGPSFGNAMVDGVNTLDPGQPAAAGVSFDGSNLRFTFSIPRGSDGSSGSNGSDGLQGTPGTNGSDGAQGPQGNAGSDGAQGPQGNDGPQGVPGEVSLTQLNDAVTSILNQSSANTNGVSTFNSSADAAYNQQQFQGVMSKLDELIAALRR